MEKLIVYTDGGSRGNPGPAAIGVVIKKLQGSREVKYKEYNQIIGETTNNEAEYQAVIFALQKIKAIVGSKKAGELEVEVRLDSELIASQLNRKYRIDDNRLKILFVDVLNLTMNFGRVVFIHIPREKNKEADRLVNIALDRQDQKIL